MLTCNPRCFKDFFVFFYNYRKTLRPEPLKRTQVERKVFVRRTLETRLTPFQRARPEDTAVFPLENDKEKGRNQEELSAARDFENSPFSGDASIDHFAERQIARTVETRQKPAYVPEIMRTCLKSVEQKSNTASAATTK